ncbi:UDP-N-acetylmuramoyl-L-alanine--D-glutamate ligase [bacterium]|nr:MAG: UDP-N-acetylmuramoyl-L-alanine--D-glutamate ligase [bacterium]
MDIKGLQNKSVGILGFGQEGQAIAEYLVKSGLNPVVYDAKKLDEWSSLNLAKLHSLGLQAVTGEDYLQHAIDSQEIIFRSPGIRLPDKQQQLAISKNITITSQTQWFFEHCPAKIIGVTGTKGKGTTSSLIYEILSAADLQSKVYLTGNIGKIQPLEFLSDLTPEDWVVYELSSFQLQDLKQSPHIGVCLMVTSDHLDYHSDLNEYHTAKSAISAFQNEEDICIYNADYEATKKIGELGSGQKWKISKLQPVQNGAWINEKSEEIQISGTSEHPLIISGSKRLLRGNHNLENIAAASLVAAILQIPDEIIKKTVNEFPGLKHRLQFVTEKKGVKYYNDSISTIPETAIAAVKAFPEESIVLILGGSEKNLDYSELATVIGKSKNIKAVVTMGPVGKRVQPLLISNNFSGNIQGPFSDFNQVMQAVNRVSETGDIVILSPAAPSFDMFEGYAFRGDEFIKQVTQ